MIKIEPTTAVYMTEDDIKLFLVFQKNYQPVAHLLGCMDSLNIQDFKNVSIVMDIDQNGKLQHTAITKHYR